MCISLTYNKKSTKLVFHWEKFKSNHLKRVLFLYENLPLFLPHILCKKELMVIRSRTCSIYSHRYVFFSITFFNWCQCVSYITRNDTIFSFFCLTKYNNNLTSFPESKTGIPMVNISGDYNECVSHCLLNNTSNSLFDTINVFLFCLHSFKERVRSGATPTFAAIKTPF